MLAAWTRLRPTRERVHLRGPRDPTITSRPFWRSNSSVSSNGAGSARDLTSGGNPEYVTSSTVPSREATTSGGPLPLSGLQGDKHSLHVVIRDDDSWSSRVDALPERTEPIARGGGARVRAIARDEGLRLDAEIGDDVSRDS